VMRSAQTRLATLRMRLCVLFAIPKWADCASTIRHTISASRTTLGEISWSARGREADAAALWGNAEIVRGKKGGKFAAGLERGRKDGGSFRKLRADARFVTALAPDLALLYLRESGGVSEASVLSRKIFESAAKREILHVGGKRCCRFIFGRESRKSD